MRILVADDDRTLTQILTATFVKRGWQAVSAADAMQALMFAKQKPQPDLILLDVEMPGGSGLKTLERLKASALTMGIPVVVITGTTDPHASERAKELGAVGFVKKPVDPEAIAKAVEKYFRMTG